MFKQSKRTLTLLVAAVAVALVWGTLSLSAPPEGKGGGKNKDEDTTPPAAVDTLAVVLPTTSSSIELGWIAVADDTGDPAVVYDIRYSTTPILNDEDFDNAALVRCYPVPAAPGQLEIVTVGDLSELTNYDLALKVADAAGNWSALSNVVSATTDSTPSGGWAIEVVDPFSGPDFAYSIALVYDGGNPSIAYNNFEYASNQSVRVPVRLARWNGAAGWEIELVEDLVGSGVDLAYNPSGEAAVSYGFSTSPNAPGPVTRTLNFARRNGPNNWSIETVDDSTGEFNFTSLAYDPSGNPSISYRLWPYKKQKNPGLKFALWDGTSWVLEMVDPGVDQRVVGNSLAYDPATGEATIAYHREDTLKFCRRDATTESWNIELVATGDHWLRGVNLVYDALSGNPSITFQVNSLDNPGDAILMFARWDGSSWVTEEVDTCPRCGIGNSLAYAADGTAYISYSAGADAGVVKLARRIGADDWNIEIVTSCATTSPTSLKFDPLGNPSVSYSDTVNEQLKFARIAP